MITDFRSCTSLTSMFFEQAADRGAQPFLWAKRDGVYVSQSWTEVASLVGRLARGLRAVGLSSGDRVMLVAENRPEWLIADLAIMTAGGITVPAYTTNTVADHQHVMGDSGARIVIVSTRQLAERVIPAAARLSHPPLVVSIEPPDLLQNNGVVLQTWDETLALGHGHPDQVAQWVADARRDDTACIIYTSGTGGAPKGVMLAHGAILHNCLGAHRVLTEIGLADESFLSFLPLSHAYEHTTGQFFPISIGAQIYYAEGIDALGNNLVEARPTIMTAVPRLYEVLRARIMRGVERTGGRKRDLFLKALDIGQRRYRDPASLKLGDRLWDAILERLVRDKVRQRFGGRLKALVSGGAPLNPDVGLFFTALGIRILQGYGQTEAAPVVSCNPPHNVKLHTVGPPLEGVEVKLAADGEILVRGELVMQGYWNDPEATCAAIGDGRWLHTGDVGEIDADGYIRITDRKKDIIVNSGGENVAPQRVEGFLTLAPEIGQAMVYGDRRPHLVAIVVPTAEFAEAWAKEHGVAADLATLVENPAFRKAMGAAIDRVNRDLSPIEKVRRFALTAEPFSVANEMMTPTMKIRRHKIREVYGARLDALYGE